MKPYPALGECSVWRGDRQESEQLDTSNVTKLGPVIPPSLHSPRWGSLEHSPQESRITKASALAVTNCQRLCPVLHMAQCILATTLWGKHCFEPHFTVEETETRGGKGTCPWFTQTTRLGVEPLKPDQRP